MTEHKKGYYRFPALSGSTLVFTSEDDLWRVSVDGGTAHRLTKTKGAAKYPAFSPEGDKLAFTATEEGSTEVYLMDATGGAIEQLTYTGSSTAVIGWTADGESIVFRSNFKAPFGKLTALYRVSRSGGQIEPMSIERGKFLSTQSGGPGRVLGRDEDDMARWKRYRGGRSGTLWIDNEGNGEWTRLLDDEVRAVRPHWRGERIYFLSDVDGYGNIYSVAPDGTDFQRHTDHQGHYARFLSSDGRRFTYSCGGDLYLYDADADRVERVEVQYNGPKTELNRIFVDGAEYLESFDMHPEGHSMAVTSRGKLFSFGHWEGPTYQLGVERGVRYRLPTHLDDERLVAVSDEAGEERLEIFSTDSHDKESVIESTTGQIGRPIEISTSPDGEVVAVTNHRYELILVDLTEDNYTVLDRSEHGRISGLQWSPEGRYLAYACPNGPSTSSIRIAEPDRKETRQVTPGRYRDIDPVFDPEGRYLYFLSYRRLNPVYDEVFFELSFPKSVKPCAVTLQTDEKSPFFREPRPPNGAATNSSDSGGDESNGETPEDEHDSDDEEDGEPTETIDFEQIELRIEEFPVPAGRYRSLTATKNRVMWLKYPVRGSLGSSWSDDDQSKGTIQFYSLQKQDTDVFAKGAVAYDIEVEASTLAYWTGKRLRVVGLNDKPPAKSSSSEDEPGRKSGWIDLGRLSVDVERRAEWRQMLREAWRLMHQHHWREDMSGVEWEDVWNRYEPILERVSTRGEFSDLIWTMQGELGTSHAYEIGGHYETPPRYRPGFLGADLVWDESVSSDALDSDGGYRIESIVRGEPWKKGGTSPLLRPGVEVDTNDAIVSIDGRRLSPEKSLEEALVEKGGREVEIEVYKQADGEVESYTVKPLSSERTARYREWVRMNREYVHDQTDGRIGYIHIPDMGPNGFAEFHRGFVSERQRDGHVIDVRFNGGGHVSALILEKLARQRLGYDIPRWGQPRPYPGECVDGPLVALTNQYAGSDGDIFSHAFKMMELGPLVGRRTWGGVVGIWPRHRLVDGSVTTQPEFSHWFDDVGFDVENYGTNPDVVVEYPPETGTSPETDPQLRRAIEMALERIENTDRKKQPDFAPYPDLSPPSSLDE